MFYNKILFVQKSLILNLSQIYKFNIIKIKLQPGQGQNKMQNSNDNEEYKKQALQFILSIYLQRQNDQDIQFLKQNVKTSVQFAENVSSNIKSGLSEENVQKNKLMYGRNSKKVIKKFNLQGIILKVIKLHYVLIFIITIIQAILGDVLQNKQIFMDAIYALILLVFVILIRIVTIYLNQKKKSEESYEKNKNQKYRVLRDGSFTDLAQTKIVVGDIIQLDYKQKVPASGILITDKQITTNQENFGKKVQKKMCIQKCIDYVDKLSILQLKIQAQKRTLPSPIILRGTQQIYGSTFKILVIAVDQQILLNRHRIPDDPTFVSDVIREWFEKFQDKVQKVMKVIRVVYLVLFISLFGFKQFLERRHLSVQMFITDLFSVLLMSILGFSVFDTNCLRLFFQTQVIRYTQNLNNPKQVDKYLTVEQIYITEDNIVKYDQIIICEVGIPDKQHTVQYQDLNILTENTRQKIEEILEGVGLKQQYVQSFQNHISKIKQDFCGVSQDNHKSQIIHLNTVDQKIFSSLYTRSDDNYSENLNKEKQDPMFSNTHQQQNASNISLNRIKPLNEDAPSNAKKKSAKFRKREMNSPKKGQTQNQQNLKGYLGQHCRFKIQNIVQSIAQLAKHESKTYYYQKYTINRLKNIPFIYWNGLEFEINKDKIEKTKRLARNIRTNQSLTPFLIGYSNGAYNNNSMNVLVAVVGVKINYQNEIIQRIKQLSSLGINSSVLIHKRQDEEWNAHTKQNFLLVSKVTNDFQQEQDYNKIILAEYINRGWITHEAQQMIDFPSLKEAGGIIRCENCFLSFCDCKNKVQEVSNIQGLMSCSQNTRIIHSINSQSDDIHYLRVGSEQIRSSVLLITKYKSDTIKILEDIKRGYYLSNILERGLNVWCGFMFVSAACIYPLALVSFGGVFCSGDISLWTLFIQSLPAIGNMDISLQRKQNTENSSRRNKVLYSKKSTLSVFLLCLISTLVATAFYVKPTFFIEESFQKIAKQIQQSSSLNFERDCKFKFSIFISDQFNKIECLAPEGQYSEDSSGHNLENVPHFIYSQNVSFIFSYLFLNMLIFLITNFKNFTKPKVLAVYGSYLGIYFLVIYVVPDLIHGRSDGLTPGQLAILFGMSILTNLVIQCFAYLSNYSCKVCDTGDFQSILTFQSNIQDHYSSKLKKYNNFQTQIYTLN